MTKIDQSHDDSILESMYGDGYVDVTGSVMCYEHGKTFECDCGQGIGVEHHVHTIECATCGVVVLDRDADERGPPARDKDQAGLTDFI